MKISSKENFLNIATKGYNTLGLLLDVFRREDGLVKRKIGSHLMYLDPKDPGISRTLRTMRANSQMREPAFMKVLKKEVEKGMTAIDIGANIGYVTLILAELVGETGHVYALEPVFRNFEILTKNIEINGYKDFVKLYQIAASNHKGGLRFYMSDKSNLGGAVRTGHARHTIDVPAIIMDDFFKDKKIPDFIKMDIEGHEVEVLEGMRHILKTAKRPMKILIEVHPSYYSEDHSLEKQLRNLIGIGFHTKYVISAGIAKPRFFAEHSYEPREIFTTGNIQRGIYTDISDEHMLIAACRRHTQYLEPQKRYTEKIVRAIMIEK